MKKIIIGIYVFSALLIGVCSIPSREHYQKPEMPPISGKQALTPYISYYAEKHRVSPYIVHKVISCESGYKYNAIGDGGNSYGLAQIHLPSHPDITKEQALDPEFAIEFLAKGLADGQGRKWTCFRKMIG